MFIVYERVWSVLNLLWPTCTVLLWCKQLTCITLQIVLKQAPVVRRLDNAPPPPPYKLLSKKKRESTLSTNKWFIWRRYPPFEQPRPALCCCWSSPQSRLEPNCSLFSNACVHVQNKPKQVCFRVTNSWNSIKKNSKTVLS